MEDFVLEFQELVKRANLNKTPITLYTATLMLFEKSKFVLETRGQSLPRKLRFKGDINLGAQAGAQVTEHDQLIGILTKGKVHIYTYLLHLSLPIFQ